MTELLSDLATPSDAELISSVRGGDVTAYGDLFARHRDAANRLARQLVRGPDADDLVSEAFAKVLSVLQGGGGPDVAFRAYLLTAVRRLHVDRMRAGAKVHTSDDMTAFDPGVPFFDTAVASFESGAAAKAFATLPERWQLVLWHLEVEGQKPADIAPLLGMSPNSVSALAYRAREGLRQAFLTMHLSDISDTDCRWVNEHLGAFVRKGLSNRDHSKVQTHLDRCRRCTAMYLELTDVNSNLAAIIAPLLLGAAATGYVASSGAAGGLGVMAAVGRVRDLFAANTTVATAGTVAAGVATVAAAVTAGVLFLPSSDAPPPQAQGRPGTSATATPPATTEATVGSVPETEPSNERPEVAPVTPEASALPAVAPVVPPSDVVPPSLVTDPPGPDQPAPADEPAPPTGPTSTDVTVASATVTDSAVDLTLEGNPSLPDQVTVRLVSRPAGITMVDDVCRVRADEPTVAVCTIEGQDQDTPAELGRRAAAAIDRYSVRLPLAIAADQPDSRIELVIDLPEGFDDPHLEDNRTSFDYHRPPAPAAIPDQPTPAVPTPDPPGPTPANRSDVAIGSLVVLDRTTDTAGTDTFLLDAEVRGVVSPSRTLTLRLGGGGRVAPAQPDGCARVNDDEVTCTGLEDPATLRLRVVVDADAPLDLVVTALPLAGLVDPDTANNTATVLLVPKPEIHLALTPLGVTPTGVTEDAADTFRIGGSLTGALPGVPVTVRLGTGAVTVGAPGPGCVLVAPRELLCESDGTTITLDLPLTLAPGSASTDLVLTAEVPQGYVDPEFENNVTPSARLEPALKADLSVGAVTVTHTGITAQGRGLDRNTVSVAVQGIPAGLPSFTLRVAGEAALTGAGACSISPPAASGADTVVCPTTGSVTQTVTLSTELPEGAAAPVDLRVQAPPPYVDYRPANDQGTAQLVVWQRVDVSLGGTTFVRDGMTTQFRLGTTVSGVAGLPSVIYTLTGGRFTGTQPPGCTVVAGTTLRCDDPTPGSRELRVTPDVPRAPGTIALRAAVPAGFHDVATGNDQVVGTPAASPDYVLASLTREQRGAHTMVHATVTDIPAGASTVRFTISGSSGILFTGGDDGSDGDGPVNCFMGLVENTFEQQHQTVTCEAVSGTLVAHMLVSRSGGVARDARITAQADGVNEYGQTLNNWRDVTIY